MATLRKGFHRGLGTLSSSGLALAVAALASRTDLTLELVITIINIFTTGWLSPLPYYVSIVMINYSILFHLLIVFSFISGSFATFAMLYPKLKYYDYCFRVFILTFCYILDSGSRNREFSQIAVTQFVLIAIGAAVGLAVNACIYPIWAGEDLHKLIVKNFMNLADSIEGI